MILLDLILVNTYGRKEPLRCKREGNLPIRKITARNACMDTLRLNNPDPNIKDRNGDSPVIKAIKEERERAPDGDSSER